MRKCLCMPEERTLSYGNSSIEREAESDSVLSRQ